MEASSESTDDDAVPSPSRLLDHNFPANFTPSLQTNVRSIPFKNGCCDESVDRARRDAVFATPAISRADVLQLLCRDCRRG